MISWIQRTFQKHLKLVLVLLLAAVIVPFVFTIGASPGIGRADRTGAKREFFGYNLASQEDQARLVGDANLSVILQAGYPALEGDQLQQYALERAAALHLADELSIPTPSKQEIADYIKTLRSFAGENGVFDANRYNSFRDSLKTNPRITPAQVSRVLAQEVRQQKVQTLLAGPGYVLDSDVRSQLARSDASWTLGVATVDYAEFKPTISTGEDVVAKFFAENSFRYEIPPQVRLSYVEFPFAAYLPSANPTDEEVRAHFDAFPARFKKPAGDPKDPAATKPAEAGDFLLVSAQVVQALQEERARLLAEKAASDLTLALFESHISSEPEAVAAFLSLHGVTAKQMAPFSRENGPAEFSASPEIATQAFRLNKSRFFSDSIATPGGAVVLFWNETVPARIPLVTEVIDRVRADYVESEKRQRFVDLGRTLRGAIESRLKAGESFEKAAANAGPGVTVKMLPPFTLRQPPQDVDRAVFGTIERLAKGDVSEMVITKDNGLMVYVADKQLPDLSPANPNYEEVRAQLASLGARVGAGSVLAQMVAAEMKKSEPASGS